MFMKRSSPILVALLMLFGLSSCSIESETKNPPRISAPSPSSEEQSIDPDGSLFGINTKTCPEFISAEQLYEFNPNYSLTSEARVNSDDLTFVKSKGEGLLCSYTNLTSNQQIDVVVFLLSSKSSKHDLETYTDFRNTNTENHSIGNSAGVFFLDNNEGNYVFINNGNLIVINSTLFEEASDLASVVPIFFR